MLVHNPEVERLDKRKLEILMENLEIPDKLDSTLEQYFTDPSLAASIIFHAYYRGDIRNKVVADLGAGNGIFSYGMSMLGAKEIYAVEKDQNLADSISRNCMFMNVNVINADVRDFRKKVDTVIMNPPFGSVVPHSDLPFMEVALEYASVIYSIHNEKSRKFVRDFYFKRGLILGEYKIEILLKKFYDYQDRKYVRLPAVLFVVRPGK
ncbi:MAG: METTL5 family protein [Candidatus Thermoplasmatota archaeon]|nr:METTL5 family protein [Candidatus Thermoplasmatota archaeon]